MKGLIPLPLRGHLFQDPRGKGILFIWWKLRRLIERLPKKLGHLNTYWS
jgi:hypothetical protein